MQPSSVSDPDYNLWVSLARTREALYKARKKELAQYSIPPRQAAVLPVVEAIGHEATPAELSRWLARESHSVSELLNRMEKQGLLRKIKDLDRKNQVRVELTQKGREAYHQVMKRESIHNIMSVLSEEQRQKLMSYLQLLGNAAMKELVTERKITYTPFPPSE